MKSYCESEDIVPDTIPLAAPWKYMVPLSPPNTSSTDEP